MFPVLVWQETFLRLFMSRKKKFHKTKIILRPVLITFGGTKPSNRQNETNNLILCIGWRISCFHAPKESFFRLPDTERYNALKSSASSIKIYNMGYPRVEICEHKMSEIWHNTLHWNIIMLHLLSGFITIRFGSQICDVYNNIIINKVRNYLHGFL